MRANWTPIISYDKAKHTTTYQRMFYPIPRTLATTYVALIPTDFIQQVPNTPTSQGALEAPRDVVLLCYPNSAF
jgi:hypothetical protein